jgi:hypothetical protein
MKVKSAMEAKKLVDIPNIGPAMVRDLARIGVHEPRELIGKDADKLYQELCKVSGVRQDPCVLDTFLAAVDFMNGAPARPWWSYTGLRKRKYPKV